MHDLKGQLMIMYDIFIASSIFLMGSFIAGIIGIRLNISLGLLLTLQLIAVQRLYKKFCFKNGDKNKKILIAFLVYTIVAPFIYILEKGNISVIIFYYVFSIAALFLTRSINISIFSYEEYIFRTKLWNIINICIMIGIGFLEGYIKNQCIVVLIQCIMVSVILLRKSRNYDNGIKSTHDKWFTVSIIGIAVLSMTQWFNNLCQNIGKMMKFVMENMFDVVSSIIGIPLNYLIGKIRPSINPGKAVVESHHEALLMDKTEEIATQQNKLLEVIVDLFENVGKALFILGITILIFAIVRAITRAVRKSLNSEDKSSNPLDGYCEIEKIECIQDKKKRPKVHIEGNNNRSKIRKIYCKFLALAKEKKIYKPSLTPTALSNQMKTTVQAPKELDIIKDIYNEGKFSNHEITKDMVNKMEDAYKTVYSKSNKTF